MKNSAKKERKSNTFNKITSIIVILTSIFYLLFFGWLGIVGAAFGGIVGSDFFSLLIILEAIPVLYLISGVFMLKERRWAFILNIVISSIGIFFFLVGGLVFFAPPVILSLINSIMQLRR